MKMGAWLWDGLAFGGFAGLFTGLWWVYPPVALIVGGVVLLAVGLFGARAQAWVDGIAARRRR